MTQERIVFTNIDGSVGVITPTGDLTIAEVMAKDVPADSSNVRQITTDDLPANRNYRNARDDSNPENFIGIDAATAGEIAHGRRRSKRDAEFKSNLEICAVAAMGLPLKSGQNSTDSSNAMTAYKTNFDDVAQIAIESAVAADDVGAIEAAEIALGSL